MMLTVNTSYINRLLACERLFKFPSMMWICADSIPLSHLIRCLGPQRACLLLCLALHACTHPRTLKLKRASLPNALTCSRTNKLLKCACVSSVRRACVRVCLRRCVRAGVCVRMCACACVRAHVCVRVCA